MSGKETQNSKQSIAHKESELGLRDCLITIRSDQVITEHDIEEIVKKCLSCQNTDLCLQVLVELSESTFVEWTKEIALKTVTLLGESFEAGSSAVVNCIKYNLSVYINS
mmetsp:Transcript_10957/g.13253  ORF Transcript_10957/g.13253 Transcript_10957/m.13253 type:complete len:109 (+) Transcript_10957:437-763(+)